MADDIDIEEHDVMDNPIIKNMFPDLSVIKKEIQGYYDEDQTIKQEPSESEIIQAKSVPTKNQGTSYYVQSSSGTSEPFPRLKTKNSEESETNLIQNTVNISTPVIYRNKIILGSKPVVESQSKPRQNSKEKELTPLKVKVVLENINTTLARSEIFCNICLILFPNKFVFECHYKKIHSYVDKTDGTLYYKCNNCETVFIEYTNLNIHYRNVHVVHRDSKCGIIENNLLSNEQKLESSNLLSKSHVCFHCKKLFKTEKNLIEHLYYILQPKSASRNINVEEDVTNMSIDCAKKHALKNIGQLDNVDNSKLSHLELLYNCPKCSHYFKSIKFYEIHMLQKHNIKKHSKPNKVSFDALCKFCETKFRCIKSYNHHLRKCHRRKTSCNRSKEGVSDMLPKCKFIAKNRPVKAVNTFYKCDICSYYFKDFKFYKGHSLRKHNIIKKNGSKKVSFDTLCKYCSSAYPTVSAYNSHISQCHKKYSTTMHSKKYELGHGQTQHYCVNKQSMIKYTKPTKNFKVSNNPLMQKELHYHQKIKLQEENYSNIVNTEDTLVLKSTLFKCDKCDVHFMSANLAMDHLKHIEILVNWKCSECLRIFKRNEQTQHYKQHSVNNNFTVYNLSEMEKNSVLYKCLKCAVHFTEDNFLLHYPICGVEIPDSVYCKICDILVDFASNKLHDCNHKLNKSNTLHLKIIEADVLMIGNKKRKNLKNARKSTYKLKSKNLNMDNEYSPSKTFSFLDLFFCSTCKCYLPYGYTHKVHLQSRCTHMVKYFCKYCGLQYTQKSIIAHKALHKRMPNLKLQDFRFYEIHNKLQIRPHLPEFHECRICKVHFISKNSIKNHICIENVHVTCALCQIKLTEAAYKLHMCFHEYSISTSKNFRNRELVQNSDNYEIITKEIIYENVALVAHKKSESLDSCHDKNTNNLVLNEVNKKKKKIESDSLEFSKIIFENDILPMDYIEIVDTPKQKSNKSNTEVSESTHEFTQLQEPVHISEITQLGQDSLEIVYLCKNCNVALDTYDRAIEHCQNHYSNIEQPFLSKKCTTCELLFDPTCYADHNDKHLYKGLNKNSFRILKFEIFYFTSNNRVWIKHVFGSLPQELITKILYESIYNVERRIKLNVIQKGNNDLTVYKCGKCRIFVHPCNIYKHVISCKSNIRKYPCSVCGLPFISAISKVEHEKIHKTSKIGLKSFRIAIFNEKESTSPDYKKILDQYVLFQCRNCNGVVEKCKFSEHVCKQKCLKKCSHCGLLIYDKEYDAHIKKHKEFDSFVSENMKVILYSIKDLIDKEDITDFNNKLPSSFIGIICDYTYYKCSKCEVCVKNKEYIATHICPLPASKTKCLICDLVFPTTKVKYHRNLHENDPYFVKENLNIIPFNITQNNEIQCNTNLKNPEISVATLKMNNVTPGEIDNESDIINQVALIYKCSCGLHFMTETSVYAHLEFCNPKLRISKQNCSKCDLLFTPKILFTHLITHHGNKKYNYTFDIVDVSKNKESKSCIYKCKKCYCHFVEKNGCEKHILTCDGSVKNVQECCGLKFDTVNYAVHQSTSHNDNDINKQHTIVDLSESISSNNPNSLLDNKSKMLLEQVVIEADMVTDAKYNFSKESLSKIDVNNYTNEVYRCKECGIHFLSKRAMQAHLNNFKKGKHKIFNNPQDICPICGINFTYASLSRHIYVHHEKLNLKAEDIIVKDYVGN